MKNVAILFFLIIFTQCKQDELVIMETQEIVNQKVSGTALLDSDGDGIGDLPMQNAIVCYGNADDINPTFIKNEIEWESLLTTITDDKGYYEFNHLIPNENMAVILRATDNKYGLDIYNSQGIDNTLDDVADGIKRLFIPIDLLENEHDDGNDFVSQIDHTSIAGNVKIDKDGESTTMDLEPFSDAYVMLSKIISLAEPEVVDSIKLDESGNYNFLMHRKDFEYSLTLKMDSKYYLWKSNDDSPDSEDEYLCYSEGILVSLKEIPLDGENNFIVSETKKPNGLPCMDFANIGPYWDAPDFPDDYCNADVWPIIAYTENCLPIRSNSLYDIIWHDVGRDLYLKQDVVYAKNNEPWELRIVYLADGTECGDVYVRTCP